MRIVKNLICFFFIIICRVFPIKGNKVVFSSFDRKQYSDNPKAISEALEKRKSCDIVWILPDGVECSNNVRVVRRRSLKSLYEMATAKVWVDNIRKPIWARKRKKQYYIQTWHGNVCIKAVEADAVLLSKAYKQSAIHDSKISDLFISGCKWRTENYKNAFWYKGEILECGLPSSDIFFQDKKKIYDKVIQYYSLPHGAKIILYAPTFRNNKDISTYNINCNKTLEEVAKKFGGDWYFILRLHPWMFDFQNAITYSNNILNGSQYKEIGDLIIASEILITDYSGCLFDGLRCKKKVFIFASDFAEYCEKERRLYFDIKNIPAAFADDNEKLIKNIREFDLIQYENKRKKFVEQLGYFECKNASDIVADRIVEVMNKQIV